MPNAYGYCRISKGRDVQVYSLDAQQAAIKRYYAYKAPEWEQQAGSKVPLVLPPFKDVKVSGRNVDFGKRPAAAMLMGRVRKGDMIIVAKTDRAFRSILDQLQTIEMFDKAGVTMHFVDVNMDTSTWQNKAFLSLMGIFAQMEHSRMVDRTKEANEIRKFIKMNPNAKAPPGWRFVHMGEGKPREPRQDHETRAVANRVFKLAYKGFSDEEIREIARQEQWKFPHRRGHYRGLWSLAYIAKLRKAATYGFPISDKDAEGNLDLPLFELEEGDEPVMPGGTIFQPDFYPAAEPLRPTEDV